MSDDASSIGNYIYFHASELEGNDSDSRKEEACASPSGVVTYVLTAVLNELIMSKCR